MLPLQAGAQRLSALANLSHSGASAAIDGEAIPKLLHLLEHSDDQGTILLKAFTTTSKCCRRPQRPPLCCGFLMTAANISKFDCRLLIAMGWAMCRREAGGDQCAAAAGQGSAGIALVDFSAALRVHRYEHTPDP